MAPDTLPELAAGWATAWREEQHHPGNLLAGGSGSRHARAHHRHYHHPSPGKSLLLFFASYIVFSETLRANPQTCTFYCKDAPSSAYVSVVSSCRYFPVYCTAKFKVMFGNLWSNESWRSQCDHSWQYQNSLISSTVELTQNFCYNKKECTIFITVLLQPVLNFSDTACNLYLFHTLQLTLSSHGSKCHCAWVGSLSGPTGRWTKNTARYTQSDFNV